MKKKLSLLLACCLVFLLLSGCGKADRYQEAAELMAAGDYAAAGEIFAELGDYKDSAAQLALSQQELSYAQALERLEGGEFNEAQQQFEALGDFRDSAEQALECRYREAGLHVQNGNYDEAVALYEALGDYKDSAALVSETRYSQALTLLGSGRYDRAVSLLRELGDYKDCPALLAQAEQITAAQHELSLAEPGSIVYFGRYEQDGDLEDGPEDLAWVLLSRENGRALLLSRDGLDCRRFQEGFVCCHWDSSTLRAWLNGEFLDAAFDEAERLSIVNTPITAAGNERYGVDGGGDSVDALFLLSADEAAQLLALWPEQAATMPTATAAEAGARIQANGCCSWWLRSPGINEKYLSYVDTEGVVSYEGMFCDNRHFAVRPALWLALSDEGIPDEPLALSATAPLPENREPEDYELAETVDMGQEYLNNIIFIGDSTSYGLTEVGVPSNQIWSGPTHTMTLYEQRYLKVVYHRYPLMMGTLKEAAADMQPDLLIITLGMRQLSMMKEELFKSEYTDLVTGIQEVSPDTKIILNSIYPVARHLDKTAVDFTNEMVSTTNGWVREVAQATGVRYLDSYSKLLGDDGFMVGSYAKGDGLHLNAAHGLPVVVNNFRTHAYF